MNDKIIGCKICDKEMKEYEGNNPQPLLENFDDRVCIDCNDFVTASRILLKEQHICDAIVNVMQLAFSLKRSREVFLTLQKEGKIVLGVEE
jgi:hypothetical protein